MKLPCQVHTTGCDLPVQRIISAVPQPRRRQEWCSRARRASGVHYAPRRPPPGDGDLPARRSRQFYSHPAKGAASGDL